MKKAKQSEAYAELSEEERKYIHKVQNELILAYHHDALPSDPRQDRRTESRDPEAGGKHDEHSRQRSLERHENLGRARPYLLCNSTSMCNRKLQIHTGPRAWL